MERDIKIDSGMKVHYKPEYGKIENGIVKSINDSGTIAFVVYKCNNEWSNYLEYTGCATNIKDLQIGWHNNPNK